MDYIKKNYLDYILVGDLLGAIKYLKSFSDCKELYQKYIDLFEFENYRKYNVEEPFDEILKVYQKYYRDIFYLKICSTVSEKALKSNLAKVLEIRDCSEMDMQEIEKYVEERFIGSKYYFLGGKTSGYYGPYIWTHSENKTFDVQLPSGIQKYTIKMADGFIMKSWMDYLSFGEIGTGGWAGEDGLIYCVASSYDINTEDFKVSLLKHEAQHSIDLLKRPDMTSEDLEYRAKLVELIYSEERNMLNEFLRQTKSFNARDGHSCAVKKIIEEFCKEYEAYKKLSDLSIAEIQSTARKLFEEDERKILHHHLR